MKKKIVCLDFDGVLHAYTSGWKGADNIPDPPVPGAIEWLTALVDDPRFEVHIYSSRSADPDAQVAMLNWLLNHGMDDSHAWKIRFPDSKPPAFVTIDDRGWRFDGTFPDLDTLASFKTWQGR